MYLTQRPVRITVNTVGADKASSGIRCRQFWFKVKYTSNPQNESESNKQDDIDRLLKELEYCQRDITSATHRLHNINRCIGTISSKYKNDSEESGRSVIMFNTSVGVAIFIVLLVLYASS